jgi:hypothetical protein
MASTDFNRISFCDKDVVNIDNWIPANSSSNPHKVRPWLVHDAGSIVCVVFADCLQDAMDEAADEGKLDRWQITPGKGPDWKDYMTTDFAEAEDADAAYPEYVDEEGRKWWFIHEPCRLGNASEPFDVDVLEWLELPNPPLSFCACFHHIKKEN